MANEINVDLFKMCNHKECIEHDSSIGEESMIHNPYHLDKNYKRPLSDHLTQANPLIGQSSEILKNKDLIFYNTRPNLLACIPEKHSPDGIRVATNYTDEMLYNSMNTCEKKAYDSLPETFTVYRGYAIQEGVEVFNECKALEATSWTVNIAIAKFFAADYHTKHYTNPKKYIITANISKNDVALVILGREEAEVKLFFESVVDICKIMEI